MVELFLIQMSDYTKLRAISEEDTNSVDELEASSTQTEISSTEGLELKSEPLKIEQGVDIAKPSPEQVAETLQNLDTRESDCAQTP